MIGKTISHYKILEKLGEGGMGVVYKAQDTKLDRFVALKFLPPSLTSDPEAKERFIHEAKAASALDHNNVCTIYEINETKDRQLFIVMACYEGEILKDKIEQAPLKLEEAMDIAIQIAKGLEKAHKKEIVHRDIKPGNIFITHDGVVKIVDFGLAKLKGQVKLTKEGTTLGTAAYMSPESARGSEVDNRTDIWSLGVVLYEMLTGQLPFRGEYEQAVTYSILNEEPEPVTALRTGIPMELERIINKCLAKEPERRYQVIQDVIVDLKEIREKQGVKTKTVTQRIPSQKSKVPLIATIAVFVIVVVLAVVYFFTKQDDVIDSIAVLPLDNLSGDPEQEYFSDGMTTALIGELSKIRALRVISVTSVMQYKDVRKPLPKIADDLNVDVLVDGTVMRVGDRVRINAWLVQPKPEQNLWANDYERDLSDILTLQKEVAREIANEIQVTLTPQEDTHLARTEKVNPEAYDAYLRGGYYINVHNEEGFKKGIEYFEKSIRLDSTFALSYVRLAECYQYLDRYGYLSLYESGPKAKDAIKRALELDESLGEAHAMLGILKIVFDWDIYGPEKDFQRAIDLSPGSASIYASYVQYLRWTCRFEDGISIAKRAIELDPLSSMNNTWLGIVYQYAGRYDQSNQQFQNALELNPKQGLMNLNIALNYIFKGIYDEAIAYIEKEMSLESSSEDPMILSCAGWVYAKADRHEDAQRLLEQLLALSKTRSVDPTIMAYIYEGLGDKEKAFDMLNKAYEVHSGQMIYLKAQSHNMLKDLSRDPRYDELLKKIGF